MVKTTRLHRVDRGSIPRGTILRKKGGKKMKKKSNKNCNMNASCGGALYGLGFIGAAVYYISTATGFWIGVLGFLKAIVWPAFLVYEALKFLGL